MIRTVLHLDGMRCGMCEAHVNQIIRAACAVHSVTSSHRKGETVILSVDAPDRAQLEAALLGMGYRVLSFESGPDLPGGIFHRLFRKK